MIARFTGVVLFLIVMGAVPADGLQKIELRDGTVLLGEVLSFDGSTYSIRTETLGTVRIERSKVRGIKMEGSGAGAQEQVREIQNRLLADPQALQAIMALQSDPDVQAVLNDPEITKAAEAGDLDTLLSNPKVIKLLQNPVVQEFGKGLLK
jgi:phosphoribosylformylglycinamidine (FGAM) synthase PurS component